VKFVLDYLLDGPIF